MRGIKLLLLTSMAVLLTFGVCFAAKYQEIDVAGVQRMMAKGGVLLVNPLTPIEYDHEHIPGSVNIPIEKLKDGLSKDKTIPIIFYCLGEKCVYSWRAAEAAVELGYTNIYAFRGGIPAWKGAGNPIASTLNLPTIDVPMVSTEKLATMLKTEDMVLLDINSEEDAEKFWIDSPKRLYVPLIDLKEKYVSVPKNKKIVVLCLKGSRSPTAARYLFAKGYKDVYAVEGGIQKWVLEGRAVRKNN